MKPSIKDGRKLLRRRELFELKRARKERVILAGLDHWDNQWEELKALAISAGGEVVGKITQRRQEPDSALSIGKGKVEVLREEVMEKEADLVIFDQDLTPAQVKNLEEALEVKVLDRSGLILDIFARRARSKEAKTQVELAQLKWLLPRLTRRWSHLSRQEGGIGTRGPGETQLEVDRRRVRKRISDLQRALKRIEVERRVQRKRRAGLYKITLVGYTNVGKSSLLNLLARSQVEVEAKLFATLDSTTRIVWLAPGTQALLTDTIGFIRRLPHHLVASFRSTLAVVRKADLLIHLVDSSNLDFESHILTVREVLRDLGALSKPTILALNKLDLLKPHHIDLFRAQYPEAIPLSVLKGWGIEELRRRILEHCARGSPVDTQA